MTCNFRSNDNESLSNKPVKYFHELWITLAISFIFPESGKAESNMKVQDVSTSYLLTEIDNTEEKLQLNT